MKKLSWLCCLVLLLAVICSVGCAEGITTPTDLCEHTNVEWYTADGGHYPHCLDCGAELEEQLAAHGEWALAYDDEGHWWECPTCGYAKDGKAYIHEASCDEPGVCATCGYEGESVEEGNHHYEYWADGDTCVYGCTVCGMVDFTDVHGASCDDLDHCAFCGHEGDVDYVMHDYDEWVSFGEEGCGFVCNVCGEKVVYDHYVYCDDPTHCVECGYEGEIADVYHDWSGYTAVDGTYCRLACKKCDKSYVNKHVAYCDDPTHCLYCGYEGTIEIILHYCEEWVSFGEEGCGYICAQCGEKDLGYHYALCDDPTHCSYCGYESDSIKVAHVYDEWLCFGEEGCGFVCNGCGKTEVYSHYAYCDNPGECWNCGYKGEIKTDHRQSVVSYDENGHTLRCSQCGETETEGHFNVCYTTNAAKQKCAICDYAGANIEIIHECDGSYEHDSTQHWYTCEDCKAVVKEAHTWGSPVTSGSKKTYTCTVCGATKTKSVASSTHTHVYDDGVTVEPTCKDEGTTTYTCTCGDTLVETLAALGHSFGAYLPNGDGTHSHTCSVCGEITTAECTMADTKIGTMDATACIYCGYLTWNLEDATDGQQQGQAVENAAFEMVDENGEPVATEGMSLIVYASAPEVTVQLDESTTVVVKHALTITLLENDQPITLEKAVKLSIPMEGNVTGLKLLVMNADGELIEIEYEVMNGMLVFETDILGIFMLVEEI